MISFVGGYNFYHYSFFLSIHVGYTVSTEMYRHANAGTATTAALCLDAKPHDITKLGWL